MAIIIPLFEHPEFDFLFAACKECDCDDWKLLLSNEKELGIIGFQCANIDCGIVGMFDKETDIIVFDFDKDNDSDKGI